MWNVLQLLFVFLFLLSCRSAMAQWTPLEGPNGGNINQIATIHGETWLCSYNGLFRSSDGGETWHHDAVFGDFNNVQGVTQFGDTVFLTNIGRFEETLTDVYMSTDGGSSWIPLGATLQNNMPHRIYKIDDVLFGAYSRYFPGQMIRSFDYGITWETLPAANRLWAWDERRILSVGYNGAYLSDDYGFTYKELLISGQYFSIPILKGDNIFIPRQDTLFISHNLGASWNKIPTPAILNNYIVNFWAGSNDTIYAAFDKSIFVSNDFGEHWNSLNLKETPGILAYSEHVVAGNHILGNSEGKLFKSEDHGNSWARADRGFYSTKVTNLAANEHSLFAATTWEILRSEDKGASWKLIFNDPDDFYNGGGIGGVTVSGEEVYFIWKDSTYYSSNNGDNFQKVAFHDPYQVNGKLLEDKKFYKNYFYGLNRFQYGIFLDSISVNQGATHIFDFYLLNGRAFVDPIEPTNVVLYADDGWHTWHESNVMGADIQGLFYSVDSTLILYNEKDMYLSYDKGVNWIKATVNTQSITAYDMLDNFCKSGDTWYASGLYGGIYFSVDHGLTWNAQVNAFSGKFISVWSLVPHKGELFAGVSAAGVWVYHSTSATQHLEQQNAAGYQIAPNPFTQQFAVDFDTPSRQTIQLSLFNSNGQLVQERFFEAIAGKNHVVIDAKNYSSGIYTIHITDGMGRVFKTAVLKVE